MTTGIHPDRAPAGWGPHHTIGGGATIAVEIRYRMIEYRLARLRTEAEHERLAATVEAVSRFRYVAAADLVETLYRGLADNSVGRVRYAGATGQLTVRAD